MPKALVPIAYACFLCSASAVVLLGGTGCAGRPAVPVFPVYGILTVGGLPAGNARIAFHPLEAGAGKTFRPVATTRADGTYRLTTFATDDGAPVGEYAITIVWPDDSLPVDECAELAHDRLQGRYADPARSPLRVTVQATTNEVALRANVAGSWSLPRWRDVAPKANARNEIRK